MIEGTTSFPNPDIKVVHSHPRPQAGYDGPMQVPIGPSILSGDRTLLRKVHSKYSGDTHKNVMISFDIEITAWPFVGVI